MTNYTLQILVPSAADVSVSGRVLTAQGRGLQNAVVTIADSKGAVRSYRTGSFGYFRFDDVTAGQNYVFQVQSKRFVFVPQIVTINDKLADLRFTAQ